MKILKYSSFKHLGFFGELLDKYSSKEITFHFPEKKKTIYGVLFYSRLLRFGKFKDILKAKTLWNDPILVNYLITRLFREAVWVSLEYFRFVSKLILGKKQIVAVS